MTFAPELFDYGLVVCYLVVLIGLGWYFRRGQHTGSEFFFAGRAMRGFPIGLSLMATCLALWSYTGVPGEAYSAGCRLLVIPLAVWCCLPLLTRTVLPLYYRLGLSSIYDYLELRYDARTRWAGSALFVLWRLVWLGAIAYAPCKVLVVWAGLPIDTWWLLVIVGAVTTLYTFLGGMRTVIWTAVVQAVVMAVGIILIVVTVWTQLDGGPSRVADVARGLGRADMFDTSSSMADQWMVWAMFPHFLLAVLTLFVADQLTVQRYLAARSLAQAKWSVVWTCVGVTILVPALVYAGLALLAFYHDHPQALRPVWVANVDHQTHRSACDTRGVPLIAWSPQAITPENIDRLVAERRLLRPNTYEPFADAGSLIVWDSGVERVDIRQLAMRRPPREGLQHGEIILNERARDELLPHFMTSQTAHGVTGWLLVAVLAASMCCLSTGIHAISTLLVVGFRRRRPAAQLSEADQLRSGRFFVVLIGIAVTLLSFAISRWDDTFAVAVDVLSTCAGPLLAVFLLGMLTRRTTAGSALSTLLVGTIFTGTLAVASQIQAATPAGQGAGVPGLNHLWPLTGGVVFSLAWGYLASLVLGRRQTRDELRGLVVGLGTLGVREPDEASIAIPDSFEDAEDSDRAP